MQHIWYNKEHQLINIATTCHDKVQICYNTTWHTVYIDTAKTTAIIHSNSSDWLKIIHWKYLWYDAL